MTKFKVRRTPRIQGHRENVKLPFHIFSLCHSNQALIAKEKQGPQIASWLNMSYGQINLVSYIQNDG